MLAETAREEALEEARQTSIAVDEKDKTFGRFEAMRLVAQSSLMLKHDPALAVLLGLEGQERMSDAMAHTAITHALARLHELRTLTDHGAEVTPAE
jgi:hypothetical protein